MSPVQESHELAYIVKFSMFQRVWEAEIKDNKLFLNYDSPDGEEGYPGDVTTEVVYRYINPESPIRNKVRLLFSSTEMFKKPL